MKRGQYPADCAVLLSWLRDTNKTSPNTTTAPRGDNSCLQLTRSQKSPHQDTYAEDRVRYPG